MGQANIGAGRVPSTVKVAVALLVAYALVVVLNALGSQASTGSAYPPNPMRVASRVGFTLLLAYGLATLNTWAWWLAVFFSGFWFLGGAAAFGMIGYAALQQSIDLISAPWLLLMAAPLLLGVVVLLLLPTSRRAFRG